MSDVIFIAATIVFFAICVLYIHWCDKIIGPDDYRSTSNPGDEPVAVVDTDTGAAVRT